MKGNRTFLVILTLIEVVTLSSLVLPFLAKSDLFYGDMPGHYFASWYIQHYLFPRPVGWNPFFYAGHAQGQFYPPLFHYLSACAGFFLGTPAGFKAVLSVSVLALPLSFYYFARKMSYGRTESSLIMFLMWLLLFFPDGTLGGNFASTYNVGMASNLFSLCLFFVYFGNLAESLKSGKYLLLSALLSMVVLSHAFAALAAVVVFLAFWMDDLKSNSRFMAKHAALSFLLVSFWVVPMIAKRDYISFVEFPRINILLYSVCLLCALLFMARYSLCPDRGTRPVLYSFLLLVLLISCGYISRPLFGQYFSRLIMFAVLLIPSLFVRAAVVWKNPLYAGISVVLGISLGIVCAVSMLPITYSITHDPVLDGFAIHPERSGGMDFVIEHSEGRILDVAPIDKLPSVYAASIGIPLATGNAGLLGLFIQSGWHSRYIMQMMYELNPHMIFPYTYPLHRSSPQKGSYPIGDQLRVFGVDRLYTSEDLNWTNRVLGAGGVKILEYRPGTAGVGFEAYVTGKEEQQAWDAFNASPYSDKAAVIICLRAKAGEPESMRIANETGELFDISFETPPGEKTVRVLLTNHFRNWDAYVNGDPVLVFPKDHYMYFSGKGRIELVFRPNLYDALNLSSKEEIMTDGMNRTFYLYHIKGTHIAEVLHYRPEPFCGDCDNASWSWFNSADISRVKICSCDSLPEYSGNPGDSVSVLESSSTGEYMKLNVSSSKPVPVYIKVSQFPNWRVYVNGEPAEIRRAFPRMMLVYGTGIIELRYEPVLSDWLGACLTIAGLSWAVCLLVPHIRHVKRNGGYHRV